MKITELISENLILPEIQASRKNDVLRELSAWMAEQHDEVREDDVARVLTERERLGSTGIGEGIAIPHGKIDSVGGLIAGLARSKKGIDFQAIDSAPTHFFVVLLAPANSAGEHLKALARVSRLFKNGDFRKRLLAAKTAREMYLLLSQEDAQTA